MYKYLNECKKERKKEILNLALLTWTNRIYIYLFLLKEVKY